MKTRKTRNYRITSRGTTKASGYRSRTVRYGVTCILIGGAMASALFAASLVRRVILASPALQVKKIQVEGCIRHTPDQIIAMAGIIPRVNLFSLNLSQICQLLENSPWIEQAKITRILPDQLAISIIERKPVALINLNQLYLVDEKGTIFKKVEKEDGVSLPILTGVSWNDLMNRHQRYASLITQALLFMEQWAKEGLDPSALSEIHLEVSSGLTVFTTHQAVQMAMGFPPFQQKCSRLRTILLDLEHKNLIPHTIDLTYSNKAFVKSGPRYEITKPLEKGGENQWEKMEI